MTSYVVKLGPTIQVDGPDGASIYSPIKSVELDTSSVASTATAGGSLAIDATGKMTITLQIPQAPGLDANGNITVPIGGDVSDATVVPTGSPAGTTGTKLADIAKTANTAIPEAAIGEPGGVAGFDANGNLTGVSGGSFAVNGGSIYVNGPAATYRWLLYQTNGAARWCVGANHDVENGNSSGSSYSIQPYNDDGSLGLGITISRANAFFSGQGCSFTSGSFSGNISASSLNVSNVLISTMLASPYSTGVNLQFISSGNIVFNGASNTIRAGMDNSTSLGNGGYRYTQLFAGTSAINTSDATEKTLASAESPVGIDKLVEALSDLPTHVYQWNDAIASKGAESARHHTGYVAQAVHDALVSAGIKPEKTAMWCRDALTKTVERKIVIPAVEAVTEKDPKTGDVKIIKDAIPEKTEVEYDEVPDLDEDGNQKYREGLRVDHVQAILIEANRRRIKKLEDQISQMAQTQADLLNRITKLEAR